ncbi:MAG: hypothetical protein M1827_000250 [Pycnora praestabilis]|nr:MAG: hypothetical protein M1827_000250 [Pycnora praestabilis]
MSRSKYSRGNETLLGRAGNTQRCVHTSGGTSAAFVLADDIPQNEPTPTTSDHPDTSTIPNQSLFPVNSAQLTPINPSFAGTSPTASETEAEPAINSTLTSSQHISHIDIPPPNPRRRRRSSSSDHTIYSSEGPPGRRRASRSRNEGIEQSFGSESIVQGSSSEQSGGKSSLQPERKRRRLRNSAMRLDTDSSTSTSRPQRPVSNGSTLSPVHKAVLASTTNGNAHSESSTNGSSTPHTNGSSFANVPSQQPTYFGHDREEVTRILIQSLSDLGYNGAAAALCRESGYELESPSVAAFRNAVLQGEWAEAEALLFGTFSSTGGGGVIIGNGISEHGAGLVLAEGADKHEMLFWMREQKFLELLEGRDLGNALMVLRQELTPLHQDIGKLHALSSLIMCQSAADLKSQVDWDGAAGQSRHELLSRLSQSISPSVMIPEHRLAVLLQQVKQDQISKCLYHNTAGSPSLYSDHSCDRSQFPLRAVLELTQHQEEVWYVEFSHNGTKLATTSLDTTVIIHDTSSFEVLHKLSGHTDGVAYASWSPDDSMLITCARDHKACLWDVRSGSCLQVIEDHNQPVTSAAWAPDSRNFVTGSLDKQNPLCIWDLNGNKIFHWPGSCRVQDCSISPDGQKLITMSPLPENRITVYDFLTREEEYNMSFKVNLTCLNISQDSRYMLVNMADNQIQLLDIETREIARQFSGQKQGNYVIRSGFGGANENFVISGSEDSSIYIWHKENGTLVETLDGHQPGCVNTVAWNPRDPCMFASAGDDKKVRIWSKAIPSTGNWRDESNGLAR